MSSIYELGKDFSFMENGRAFDMIYHQTIIPDIQLKMLGKHQKANASLAAMTALILQKTIASYYTNYNQNWSGRDCLGRTL